jgi:hypothetical protein
MLDRRQKNACGIEFDKAPTSDASENGIGAPIR